MIFSDEKVERSIALETLNTGLLFAVTHEFGVFLKSGFTAPFAATGLLIYLIFFHEELSVSTFVGSRVLPERTD